MGRTDVRTDWRTDGQGGDYMLPRNFSGSIKTIEICNHIDAVLVNYREIKRRDANFT